jgi:hypothetical protein
MANLGGNQDGTMTDAVDDAGGDNGDLHAAQRDVVLPLGRNGCQHMLSPGHGVNGIYPYYGPGFVPSAGGNGHLEHQIVPASQLVTEVNQRIHGGQVGPLDQLRARSMHERLGPHPDFRHDPENGAFHTPPGLPHGAGYGHAPSASQLPHTGGNIPTIFVPTTGGVAPGPHVAGGALAAPDPDPLQALAATLHANLAQFIQAGIRDYMQARVGGPVPPPRAPAPVRPEAQ